MTKKLSNKKRIVSKMNNIKSLKNMGKTKNKKMSSNSRKARLVGGRRVKGKKSKYMKKNRIKQKGGSTTETDEVLNLRAVANQIIQYLKNKPDKVDYDTQSDYPYTEAKLLNQLTSTEPKARLINMGLNQFKIKLTDILPFLTVEYFTQLEFHNITESDTYYGNNCIKTSLTIIKNLKEIYNYEPELHQTWQSKINDFFTSNLRCFPLSTRTYEELANLYFTKYITESQEADMYVLSCHGSYNVIETFSDDTGYLQKMTIFALSQICNTSLNRDRMFSSSESERENAWKQFFKNQEIKRGGPISISTPIEYDSTLLQNFSFNWSNTEQQIKDFGNCVYKNGIKINLSEFIENQSFTLQDFIAILSSKNRPYYLWLHTCLGAKTPQAQTNTAKTLKRRISISTQKSTQKLLNELNPTGLAPKGDITVIPRSRPPEPRGASKAPPARKK